MNGKVKYAIIGGIITIIAVVAGIIAYNNSSTVQIRKQIDLGNRYLSEQNYEQAIVVFKGALEIVPDEATAIDGLVKSYIGWGESEMASGSYQHAIEILTEGVVIFPDSTEITEAIVSAYISWIDFLIEQGESDQALLIAEKGFEQTQDNRLKEIISELKRDMESSANDESETQIETDLYDNMSLFDFSDLVYNMHDVITYRQMGGYDAMLSFEDRKKDYDPLIQETEQYIDFLIHNPIDELCDHTITGESSDYPIPNRPVYIEGEGEYPRLGDAYVILAHYYLRIGDMEKSYEIRQTLADYLDDDSVLDDYHTVEGVDGHYYDRYGRAVEWMAGDEVVHQWFTERGNGLLRQESGGQVTEHEYDEDGRLLSYHDSHGGWSVSYENGKAYINGEGYTNEYTITKYGYGQSTEYLREYEPDVFSTSD